MSIKAYVEEFAGTFGAYAAPFAGWVVFQEYSGVAQTALELLAHKVARARNEVRELTRGTWESGAIGVEAPTLQPRGMNLAS